jgi:hypothetical protein
MRLQATGAVVGAGVIWFWWRGWGPGILLVAVSTLAVLAWVSPRRYAPVHRFTLQLGRVVLAVVTWLLLGLVYFFIMTPWRAWRAVTGHDPLCRRWEPQASSYLRAAAKPAADHFRRQF